MDRNKVIKGLEVHSRSMHINLCGKCPYQDSEEEDEEGNYEGDCTCCLTKDALYLLKEQKAVEPTIDEYGNKRCGSCGHKLQSIADPDLFCCKCGKPVLWEGR